ncbi:hypothetical protein ACO2WH_28640, partial [Escherichia coli]|uniref:hypothetical protein n=1 Tax=Escherichia coli TaxID=562 RepID=UPI003C0E6902
AWWDVIILGLWSGGFLGLGVFLFLFSGSGTFTFDVFKQTCYLFLGLSTFFVLGGVKKPRAFALTDNEHLA